MRFPRIAALMLAAIVALTLAACGSDSGDSDTSTSGSTTAAADEKVEIAFVGALSGSEGVIRALDGMRAYAEANNASVTGFDTGFDPQRQLRVVQDMVTTGKYDAMIVNPFDQTGGNLKAACDARMPVITLFLVVGPDINGTRPQTPCITGQVYQLWSALGTTYGKAIIDVCRDVDPCKVAWIPGQGLGAEVETLNFFKREIASSPNIKVIETKPGNFDPGISRGIAADVIQANPDLSVIATLGDQVALGVVPALENAGKQDSVKVFGTGASQKGIDAVRAGKFYATIPMNSEPNKQGEITARMAIQAARGETVDPNAVQPTTPEIPEVLTQDNQDEWATWRSGWQG